MRIKEKFKKLGYFWLPSVPNKKAPGTLSISDEGIIELEVIRGFDDDRITHTGNRTISQGTKRRLPINRTNWEVYLNELLDILKLTANIIKMTDGLLLITVNSLVIIHSFSRPTYDIDKLSIFVDRAFIRAEYGEGEIPRFKNFIFPVEEIEEWSGISNFRMLGYDGKNTTLSYQVPKDASLNLNNGMQLLITFPHTYSSIENKITQKTYFRLFSRNALELDEFISVAEKIRAFLCFAINEMIPFDSTSAALNNHQAHTGNSPLIDIYDSRCFYLQDEPKINKGMLFKFEKIQTDVELIINKWIEVCEDIRPALDLYLTAQEQQYLTTKFLTLMQGLEAYHKGLEAYHKRTSGKKPSEMILKERLMCLSEPLKDRFENENMRDKWMTDRVKNARNQLTHKGKLESTETYGKLNDFITGSLQLFQINLLQLIGFSQEDIDSILASSIPIRRRS